jgi:hypothetical protein
MALDKTIIMKITESTTKIINDINKQIQTSKCPDLKITIEKSGDQFKLCLNNKENNCISQIVINNDDEQYNILSNTKEQFRKQNYNKFLTAISIVIAKTLNTELQTLFSSTFSKARMSVLEYYKYRSEYDEDDEDDEDDEEKANNYYLNLEHNKVKAEELIEDLIKNNKLRGCDQNGGSKRNKSKRNKSKPNKSKPNKSKRSKSKRNKSKRNKSKRNKIC